MTKAMGKQAEEQKQIPYGNDKQKGNPPCRAMKLRVEDGAPALRYNRGEAHFCFGLAKDGATGWRKTAQQIAGLARQHSERHRLCRGGVRPARPVWRTNWNLVQINSLISVSNTNCLKAHLRGLRGRGESARRCGLPFC